MGSIRIHIINRWHGPPALATVARCDWRRVTDPDHNRVLELDDPTSVVEHCEAELSDELYSDPFDRAIELHRASQFHEADLSLGRSRRSVNWRNTHSTRVDTYPFRVLRDPAWVQSRLGRLDAIEFLDRIYGSQASPEAQCCKIGDYLYCYRFLGLVPHPMFEGLIEPAMQFLTTPAPSDEPMQAHVREHLVRTPCRADGWTPWTLRSAMPATQRLFGVGCEFTASWPICVAARAGCSGPASFSPRHDRA